MATRCCCEPQASGKCCCHEFDVVFLLDTTVSMLQHRPFVHGVITSILNEYRYARTCNWGLVQYRDSCDFPLANSGVSGENAIICSGEDDVSFHDYYTFEPAYEVVVPINDDVDNIINALDCIQYVGGGDRPEQWLPALKYIAENWTEDWTRYPWKEENDGVSGVCYEYDFYEGLAEVSVSGETSCVTNCLSVEGKTQRNLIIHFGDALSKENIVDLNSAASALQACGIYYLGFDLGLANEDNQMCELAEATCGWCFGCGEGAPSGLLGPDNSGCSHHGTLEDLLCCILCRRQPEFCNVYPPDCKVCCTTPQVVELTITTPPTNLSCSDCGSIDGTYYLSQRFQDGQTGVCCYQLVDDNPPACYDTITFDVCYEVGPSGTANVSASINAVPSGGLGFDFWEGQTGLLPTPDCPTIKYVNEDTLGWNCCNTYTIKQEPTFPVPTYVDCDWTDVEITVKGRCS